MVHLMWCKKTGDFRGGGGGAACNGGCIHGNPQGIPSTASNLASLVALMAERMDLPPGGKLFRPPQPTVLQYIYVYVYVCM